MTAPDLGDKVQDVRRLTLGPDDVLVIRFGRLAEIDMAMADEIRGRVRQITGRPELPVLVIGAEDDITVATIPKEGPS